MLQPNLTKKPKGVSSSRSKSNRKPWDDRFWMGVMPVNSSTLDLPLYTEDPDKSFRSKNQIKLPQLSSRPSSGRTKSLERNTNLNSTITEEMVNTLKNEIETEWELRNIPNPQRDVFRSCVFELPRNKGAAIISRELEDLRKNRSLVQIAIRAVQAREESLKSIKEMNEYLAKSPDWEKLKDVQLECAELLHAHRILTLNVVESIVRWREQLVYAMLLNQNDSYNRTKSVPFMFEGVNYMAKMKHDLNFLTTSDFAKIFTFSEDPDPLLVVPSKVNNLKPKTNKKRESYFMEGGQVLIPLPGVLLKRVRLAEMVIMEDSNNEWDLESKSIPSTKLSTVLGTPLHSGRRVKRYDDENRMAQYVLEDIIEQEVESELSDMVAVLKKQEMVRQNDAASKYLADEILGKELVDTLKKIAYEQLGVVSNAALEKHLEQLTNKLFEIEMSKMIESIAKDELKFSKEEANRVKEAEKRKKDEAGFLAKDMFTEILTETVKNMLENEIKIQNEFLLKKEKNTKEIEEKKRLDEENQSLKKMIAGELFDEVIAIMIKEELDRQDADKRQKDLQELENKRKAEERNRIHEEEKLKAETDLRISKEIQTSLVEEAIGWFLTEMSEAEIMDGKSDQERLEAKAKAQREAAAKEAAEKEAAERKAAANEASKRELEIVNLQLSEIIFNLIYQELEHSLISEISLQELTEFHKSLSQEKEAVFQRQITLNNLNDQIVNTIERVLIEESITSLKLEEIAESLINEAIEMRMSQAKNEEERRLLLEKEKRLLDAKLTDIFSTALIDDFINDPWVIKLCENMVESAHTLERRRSTIVPQIMLNNSVTIEVNEAEDYVIENFTPGAHSPNAYSAENSLDEEERNLVISSEMTDPHEGLGLDFAGINMFKDLKDVNFKPLGMSEQAAEYALNEYYNYIPSEIKAILPSLEQLLAEVTTGVDTCWYWIVKAESILGLLVYSLDCETVSGRNLIIHHISCLSDKAYQPIIDLAADFLWTIDTCDEIRLNLSTEIGRDVPTDIKKMFTNLKFKWKTQKTKLEYNADLTVMGKTRSNVQPLKDARSLKDSPFALKTICVIEASTEDIGGRDITSPEMIKIGNRQCLLNGVLNLFGKLDKSGISLNGYPKTRLQGDVSDILEIINSTDSFNFPFIKAHSFESQSQAAHFLQENQYTPAFAPPHKSSISVLDVKFKWISCTNTVKNVNGQTYKFMRFKTKLLKHYKNADNGDIYVLPTGQSGLNAFFIKYDGLKEELMSDLKRFKTDLSYKMEDLLKNMNEEGLPCNELWVPGFNKGVNWNIPWIEGYEIPPQHDESASQYIKRCLEDVTIENHIPAPAAGILDMNPRRADILTNDFIFGLMNTSADKILDFPLFVSLVEPNDWILA